MNTFKTPVFALIGKVAKMSSKHHFKAIKLKNEKYWLNFLFNPFLKTEKAKLLRLYFLN